jgi:hypothetical protein
VLFVIIFFRLINHNNRIKTSMFIHHIILPAWNKGDSESLGSGQWDS